MGVALQGGGDPLLGPALPHEPERMPALALAWALGLLHPLAHLVQIEVPSFQQSVALHVAPPTLSCPDRTGGPRCSFQVAFTLG
jgi:hypothetical protein